MAETTYTYSIQNDFPNHKVDPSRLYQEIQLSVITIAVASVTTDGDNCGITFKDILSTEAKDILDHIIAVHSGEQLPVSPILVRQADVSGLDPDTALNCTEFVVVETVIGESVSAKHFMWPFPIDIVAARYLIQHPQYEFGDKFDVCGIPPGDATVGVVTTPVVAGNKIVPVNETIFKYVRNGIFVKFNNNDEEYRVDSVNAEAGVITLIDELEHDVVSLEEIKLRRPFVIDGWVHSGVLYPIGDLTSGSSVLEKHAQLRIRYFHKTIPTEVFQIPFSLVTYF